MSQVKNAMPVVDLRSLPIPEVRDICDTDDYQSITIDRSAAEFTEPLVDLARFGIATQGFFAVENGRNAPVKRRFLAALDKLYARIGVAEKLQQVNRTLAPYGVEVLVLDAFRPLAVQRELWQWFLNEAERLMPDSSREERERYALRYCSDPSRFDQNDATTWPTHSSGGALDLTLRSVRTHKPVRMGSRYLDPAEITTTRFFEIHKDAVTEQARRNRRLLFWAMTTNGFVNYPCEWWHFDFLTQAWVMNQGRPAGLVAKYGLANNGEPPR